MNKQGELVLVGVVKRKKDLDIAIQRQWYRIHVRYAPKKNPSYLAIYETRALGKRGRGINYYARINKISLTRRKDLLPEEKNYTNRLEWYYKFHLGPVKRTPYKINNQSRRRISFGFTSLKKLLKAKEMSEVFNIIPLEEIMRKQLKKYRLCAFHEYCLVEKGWIRYRLDFAIFCRHGKVAIECDNPKWHSLPRVKERDRMRDRWLRSHGWTVFHFSEREIVDSPSYCLQTIRKTIDNLGGIRYNART